MPECCCSGVDYHLAYFPVSVDDVGLSALELSQPLAPMRNYIRTVAVDPSAPAYQAGVREVDLVQVLNRQSISNVAEFEHLASGLKKGDYVLLRIQRSKSSFFIAFML